MAGLGMIAVMAALEFLDVGVTTLYKAAMDKGVLNQFVFMVYSNVLALFVLSASCFLFYRKRACVPLSWNIVFRILLLAIISCILQIMLIVGVKYSSPTMSSAMIDLVPAYTFLIALLFRMEKLDYKLRSSQAKLIGTLVSIAGALIITLYKGHQFTGMLAEIEIPSGSFCIAIGFATVSWILKDYPEDVMVMFLCNIMVMPISTAVSLCFVHDPSSWAIRMNIGLLAIAINGILCIAMKGTVHTWACRKKGPVYVAMFKPLGMVIAMALGILFLGDAVYLGRLIGATIIALGFYAAMWGEAQELDHHVGDSRGQSNCFVGVRGCVDDGVSGDGEGGRSGSRRM
ncbi:WAT1-related protein At3g28050 [Linum perenne]